MSAAKSAVASPLVRALTSNAVALEASALVNNQMFPALPFVAKHIGVEEKNPTGKVPMHVAVDLLPTVAIIPSGLLKIEDPAARQSTDPTPTLTTLDLPANTLPGMKGLGRPWDNGMRVKVRSVEAAPTIQVPSPVIL